MANVSALNLNGTDYDVEDTTSRSAQLALDEKCDNIGTQIEQELAPVTADVATLKEQSQEYAARITALENKPTPFAAKTLFESEEGQGTGSISLAEADPATFAYLVEAIVTPQDGKQVFMLRGIERGLSDTSRNVNIISLAPGSSTSGAVYAAERPMVIYAGSTALGSWRIQLENTKYYQVTNLGQVSTRNDYLVITKVVGLSQG